MLLFVEHKSNQRLPKAEDCDEVNEVPSGVTMLQVSVPRRGGGGGDWLGQSSQLSPWSLLLTTSSAEAL